jgi:2'-5' RNA ligase
VDLVRVDFALIPDAPLFTGVIAASQAITDEFYYNENVIDDKTFPPHLSLLICTVPRTALPQAIERLDAIVKPGLPELTPTGVEPSYGGYVMLNVERTSDVMALHESVLDIAAEARKGVDSDKYGSQYIRDSFTPHISLAKVDRRDQDAAVAIGKRSIGELSTVRTRAFDLCDIGERSERWEILANFPTE